MLDVPEWTNILKSKCDVGNGKHIPKAHGNWGDKDVNLCSQGLLLQTFFGQQLKLHPHIPHEPHSTYLSPVFSIYADETCREGYFDLLEMGFSRTSILRFELC